MQGLTVWKTGIWAKVWSIILMLVILSALGSISYIIATPKVGERFTEFYIQGLSGKATDYPSEVKVGEAAKVTVGIANHEYYTVSYLVELRIDGMINNKIGPILLEHGEKYEEEVVFVPHKAGDNQKLELLLYKEGEANPYSEPLRLWLDVRE